MVLIERLFPFWLFEGSELKKKKKSDTCCHPSSCLRLQYSHQQHKKGPPCCKGQARTTHQRAAQDAVQYSSLCWLDLRLSLPLVNCCQYLLRRRRHHLASNSQKILCGELPHRATKLKVPPRRAVAACPYGTRFASNLVPLRMGATEMLHAITIIVSEKMSS